MRGKDLSWRLARLRQSRVRGGRETPIADVLGPHTKTLNRDRKRLGGLAGAINDLCPPVLLARVSIEGFERGVLRLAVEDSSTRFELDRWLRAGGQDLLSQASPAALRKVRVRVGGVGGMAGVRGAGDTV